MPKGNYTEDGIVPLRGVVRGGRLASLLNQGGLEIGVPVTERRMGSVCKSIAMAAYTNGPIVNVSTVSATFSSAKASNPAAANLPFYATTGGKCFKLEYEAPTTYPYGELTTSITIGSVKRIGVWIYKACTTSGAQSVSALSIYLNNTSTWTNYVSTVIAVYPGLNFYSVPFSPDGVTLSDSWIINGSGIDLAQPIIRVRFRDSVSGTGVITPHMVSGEYYEIGDIFPLAAQKAKFMIGFDDCTEELIVPGGPAVVGGDGIARIHSYASFAESYGWRVTAYAISGAVGKKIGANRYLTATELARCRDDYGVVIGSHSRSHPIQGDVAGAASGAGLRLLGPHGYSLLTSPWQFTASTTGLVVTASNDSSAILADIAGGVDDLRKMGFRTAEKHFATPQGMSDFYVNQAIEACGFTSVRHTSIYHYAAFGTRHTSLAVSVSGELNGLSVNLPGSIQTDNGAVADATILAYLSKVIAFGSCGTNYAHGFKNSTTQAKTKLLFDALKAAEIAGTIDVICGDDI